jgi:hypothetical protein
MLTAARVHELLTYDPATGIFRWRVSRRGGTKAGDIAGTVNGEGRRMIGVDGERHRAHRLAWLYMTGDWPSGIVDHEDLDPDNNRWKNLRQADQSQNQANAGLRADNTTGAKGVVAMNGKFMARIRHHGQRIYLGTFDTVKEAAAAYAEAAFALHGKFARLA